MNHPAKVEKPAALSKGRGPAGYARAIVEHRHTLELCVVNGHVLRQRYTRHGIAIEVVGTGQAFQTLREAADHATRLPPGDRQPGFRA